MTKSTRRLCTNSHIRVVINVRAVGSRDAREFNANFNMVLDRIKERIDAESEVSE